MGSDVIHLCGQTSALGIDAESRTSRVLLQEATSCLFPPYGVAALPGGWSAVCCQLHGVFGVAMFAACFQDIEAARFNVGFSLAPDPPLRRIIVLLRRDHNGPLLGFVSRVTYGASWVVLPALNLGNSATPAIARPVFTTPQLWLAIPFLNTLAEQKTNSPRHISAPRVRMLIMRPMTWKFGSSPSASPKAIAGQKPVNPVAAKNVYGGQVKSQRD